MQDSSAFQFIAIDTIHESATNPRKTFDESKLHELADSIRQHGLIQPITVRPNNQGFEIVAGARRFRAAQLAEQFAVPARIVDIDDGQTIQWQIIENSLRIDVHPYEEASGYKRLLGLPGYDVPTIAQRTGKSSSHIYARLSLLQLIPQVADAFLSDRIAASHANLIARLPEDVQAQAYEQCWRKDWQDKEPHLLPAKHVAAWIQANLYLSLVDAPFDREDPTLNPAAGACVTCPRRSGYNTALFADVVADHCLDGKCWNVKLNGWIDREIAAHPGIVQIENGWRNPKEQRPGAVQRGHVREIPTATDNPDAEPAMPCAAAQTAIVVYGKQIGRKLTVCTDRHCPVHDPQAVAEAAAHPAPAMTPAHEYETEEQAAERQSEFGRQRAEYEAEQNRRAEILKTRQATFERIVANAPPMFTVAQLRLLLRALIHLDPYTLTDDVAEHFANDDEDNQRSADEILAVTLTQTPDEKLTGFALSIVLTGSIAIPREDEFDFLAQAQTAFLLPKPAKGQVKKPKAPTLIKASTGPKKNVAKRNAA
jgi:ParB family chromosome partitioning protein